MLPPFSLEMTVLRAACSFGRSAHVGEIATVCARFTGEYRAYTTIKTVLDRLCDKDILTRKRDGRRFLYTPIKNIDGFCLERLRQLNETLYAGAGWPYIIALCEQEAKQA